MSTRLLITLLLLPILLLGLPLMFAMAWLHEIIADLKPRPSPPPMA
jgi:hypothetical protein